MDSLTYCTYLSRCQDFNETIWSLVMKEREVFTHFCMADIFISYNSFYQIMHEVLFYQIYYWISMRNTCSWLSLINQIMQMHTMQMITHLILDGILCKSCFPPHDFLLSFPRSLFSFSCSPVPLSLSRTFVVSRAESLAGSPGTTLVSSPFYSFIWIIFFTSEYLNGASWVFTVQGPHYLLQRKWMLMVW